MRVLGKPVKVAIMKGLGSLSHVMTQVPAAALTFDDGPHPQYTPGVLDILERHQARGTFFMVGEAAQEHPDLVRRIGEAGHAVGAHSWNHSSFPHLTSSERRKQMRACQTVLAPYGQRLFRPPYGEQSIASRLDALWLGYEVVGWSLDVGDWYETDSSLMASRLIKGIKPGCVVLLHDALFDEGKRHMGPKHEREACVDRAPMLRALDLALDHLRHQIRFVTVPELLHSGMPYRQFWFKKTPPG
jgi:peptidoglycan/xylan/chitin deacetylase (PgdA/CDA1 family)